MRSANVQSYRAVILAVTLAAFLPLTSAAGRSHDEPAWPLYVHVEQDGKLVTGLTSSNFRVFLDGRGQAFELETPETPATVVLLVEYSQRSWLYLDDIRNSVQGFVEHAPAGHWYALVTFDHNMNVVVDFTKDKNRIATAFSELPQPQWDEIDTYDALSDILDTVSRLSGRRVIIFIGSGFDTFSAHTLGDVEKKVESADVTVYCLGAGSALRTYYSPYLSASTEMDLHRARAFLTMLADKTGGDAWFPNFETAFRDAIEGVMQTLAAQYKFIVKGTIPTDGRFHKIKVEAFTITNDKRKDFKVRVREGFRRPA
jgi:VWFA-related protein